MGENGVYYIHRWAYNYFNTEYMMPENNTTKENTELTKKILYLQYSHQLEKQGWEEERQMLKSQIKARDKQIDYLGKALSDSRPNTDNY